MHVVPVAEVDSADEFLFVFRVENLQLLVSADYEVNICIKGLSTFESTGNDIYPPIKYWVAVEKYSNPTGTDPKV